MNVTENVFESGHVADSKKEASVGLLVFVFSNCLQQDLTFGHLTMPRSPTNQFHATVTSVSFASV